MKRVLAATVSISLGLGLAACGDTARRTSLSATQPHATSKLLGDGDGDNPEDLDSDDGHNDGLEDHDNDYPTLASRTYHDSDDGRILDYGHQADNAETRAVIATVGRYYTAAAQKDGTTACSLILSGIARSVRQDYGEGPGPAYLRGGKSCPAILTMLFDHFHGELRGQVVVTGVRVSGRQAEAFVGSATMPAGYVMVEREDGKWKLQGLVSTVLP